MVAPGPVYRQSPRGGSERGPIVLRVQLELAGSVPLPALEELIRAMFSTGQTQQRALARDFYRRPGYRCKLNPQ